MLSQSFELKVGFLGHVSVGKTTGLNALLQEKFSEVSMKRTTAGINLYRISSLSKSAKCAKLASSAKEGSMDWQEVDEAAYTSSETSYAKASDILKETTSDNARLRTTNELHEKIFDIELDEPLLKDTRDDTRLVLVDIPGINEAGTRKIYMDYVENTWSSYDAMIVVMDAKQGVNTDEQVGLLNFVKMNLITKKQMPIIVVCNKVDDPDDDELMGLVKEAQQEVEKIFSVADRVKALEALLGGREEIARYRRGGACNRRGKKLTQLNPAFIPLSFENAFLYRSAYGLPARDLERLDKVYIDKIGHEEVGKFKWKKLSNERKYELVHRIVSDPAEYQERLEASNFHKLLAVLQHFLGGKETQEKLIAKQLDVALSKMSIINGEGELFTDQLAAVFNRYRALGKDSSHLAAKFWSLYKELKADCFEKVRSNPLSIDSLDAPMRELIKYAEGLQNKLLQCHPSIAKEENKRKVIDVMKELIKQQISLVIEKAGEWKPQTLIDNDNVHNNYPTSWSYNGNNSWHNSYSGQTVYSPKDQHPADRYESSWTYKISTKKWMSKYSHKEVDGSPNENPVKLANPLSSWAGVSPKDWSTITGSILLLSRNKAFYEAFGQQIIDLEWMGKRANFYFNCKGTTIFGGSNLLRTYYDFEEGQYIGGVFTPKNKSNYDRVVQIKVPDSLSSPSHWGHLAWLFCEFMDLQAA